MATNESTNESNTPTSKDAPVDAIALIDGVMPWCSESARKDLTKARAAVAELVGDGSLGCRSPLAEMQRLRESLAFDDRLSGNDPGRSTLDFPAAIAICDRAIAALAKLGGA